ncbi:MAG: YceI family protein [Candidatus Cyclobacteriaceae bacterium M2_1C_046]
MNKCIVTGILIFILLSCTKFPEVKENIPLVHKASFNSKNLEERKIDLQNSEIKWKATKLLGTAGHEGMVNLKSGSLYFQNEALVKGNITVDLNTIRITDTSKYSAEEMRMLSNHLKRKEFNTGEYPLASFEFENLKYLKNDNIQVTGNMRIKDVIKPVSFPATIEQTETGKLFLAEIILNRKDYNIGIDGNLLEKNLVDDEFQINVRLRVSK